MFFKTLFKHAFSKCVFSHIVFHISFTKLWKQCETHVKKCVLKIRFCSWKKCEKKAFWKCIWKNIWKNGHAKKMWTNVKKKTFEHPVGKVQLWNLFFRFDFLGSSFAAVTLLPAQLLQVENQRGAVQIDRKWTVKIADLFNLSTAKQWLPGAITSKSNEEGKKENNASKLLQANDFVHVSYTFKIQGFHISKLMHF